LRVGRLLSATFCFFLAVSNIYAATIVFPSLDVIEVRRINSPLWDGVIDNLEWLNATFLKINFTFANGESYRASVYLGHNDTHFFVGAIIFDVGPNPFSVPEVATRPDGFFIYFDVNNDGELTAPEDAKGLLNFLVMYQNQIFGTDSINEDGFWKAVEDADTIKFWRERRPEINQPVLWSSDGKADITGHGEYINLNDNSLLDETFEFCFPLDPNDTFTDGLHIKIGEVKTIGCALAFYRQGCYFENGTATADLYDLWPGDGFTPNVLINASQYAKIKISLEQTKSLKNNDLWLVPIMTIGIIVIFVVAFNLFKILKRKKFKFIKKRGRVVRN